MIIYTYNKGDEMDNPLEYIWNFELSEGEQMHADWMDEQQSYRELRRGL